MSEPGVGFLTRALDRTPVVDLLPERRAAEAARVEAPLALMSCAPLGDGLFYTVIRDARGVVYGIPVVATGDRLRRAVAGDGAAEALLCRLEPGLAAPLTAELLDAQGTGERAGWATGEQAIPVDQTNDLVVVGQTHVVKWLLHPVPEPQPTSVRARQLQGVPEVVPVRALVHAEVGHDRLLVATVVDAVPDAEDGWTWAVDDVRALAVHGPLSHRDRGTEDPHRWPSALGEAIARLHVALAAQGRARATPADAEAWYQRARHDLDDAGLDATTAEAVRVALAPLRTCTGTPVIGIHGDLHVGQVLRTRSTGALQVIDFDGSPLLSAEENLRLQPAARDVAGMLASLDHVGRVVLHRSPELASQARDRVLEWMGFARESFLASYRDGLVRGGLPDLLDERLLHPMLVQQECREYAYARRYLPHWRYVPDAALPPLLKEPIDGH